MGNDPKFCGSCGVKLSNSNAKTCVKCGCDPHVIEDYCIACGDKRKSKNSLACVKCGAGMNAGQTGKQVADPSITLVIGCALLIADVISYAAVFGICLQFFISPALTYFYVGKWKKALVYLVGVETVMTLLGFVGGLTLTFGVGAIILAFAAALNLIVDILMVMDAYKIAKGEKSILPDL